MDWQLVFETALSQGIFCALFVGLFIYVMQQNSQREKQLQNLINDYNQQLKHISETLIKIQEALEINKKHKKKVVSE